MHRTIRILCLALAGLVVLGVPAMPAWGRYTPDEARAKLAANNRAIALAKARIASAKRQEAGLAAAVARLDDRLNAINGKLANLQGRITDVSARLTSSRARLAGLAEELRQKRRELQAAQTKLVAEQQAFSERVVATYKAGDATYIDLIVGSTGFEDLISRLKLVRSLIASDNQVTGDLQAVRDTVAVEKAAVAADTEAARQAMLELQSQRDELAGLRAAQARQRAGALAARADKTRTLAKVETNRKAWEQQEAQMAADSAQLVGIIRGNQGTGGGHISGRMYWPAAGPVTSPFGWRMHPIFHVMRFHTGIDIGAPYGAPIHAADPGTVIYATWMGGYGNVIIIDHGGGISTLYAHQSSLAVGYGARVGRGQVIGYVGSTGFSTGPHLHFEVRVNGNPVDPMKYL
jgi:murein DD-endopeptidase MepM/ murein hydrolase activator NlpD